jgi:hypothetical protein
MPIRRKGALTAATTSQAGRIHPAAEHIGYDLHFARKHPDDDGGEQIFLFGTSLLLARDRARSSLPRDHVE